MNHAREGAFQTFTAPLRSIIRVPYTKHNHKQNLLDEIYENKVWVKLVGRKLLGNDSIRGWNETDTFSHENFSCRLRVVRPRNFRWIFKRRSPTRASLPFHAQGPHVESLVASRICTRTQARWRYRVLLELHGQVERCASLSCIELKFLGSPRVECAAGAAASRHFLLSSPRSPRIVAERNRTRRFFSFSFGKILKTVSRKNSYRRENRLSLSLSLIDSQGKTDGRDGKRRWDRWGKFVKSIYRGS